MRQMIEKLVQDFERGGITRRELIQSLGLALAAVGAGAAPGEAAGPRALQVVDVNHISYRVADYAKTRDFYAGVLGMKVLSDTGKQCSLAAGDTILIARNWPSDTPRVDHVAYSLDDWNKDKVEAELKQRGLNPRPDTDNSFHIEDPNGFDVQLCNRKARG